MWDLNITHIMIRSMMWHLKVREADISVANLESPFVSEDVYRYKYEGKRLVFLDSSPQAAQALK